MKVSLVVASGAYQGKVVPIVGSQFVIGRDPQCHLRPASQAVSKQHCAVIVRDGKVYLKDFGSTNGSVVNDTIVKGEERELKNNDALKVGPLDFTVRIEPTPAKPDGTPLPDMNPESAAALAAVKAAAATPAKGQAGDRTPAPGKPATGSKEAPALAPQEEPGEGDEQDRLAAMLLGLDDGEVPGGSTVVDTPLTGGLTGSSEGAGGEAKSAAEKKPQPEANTSDAASELLRKYMRRPR